MSDNKHPVDWSPLTAEQWTQVPRADHTSLFSREEVTAALRLLAPPEAAEEIARELFEEARERGSVFFMGSCSPLSPA